MHMTRHNELHTEHKFSKEHWQCYEIEVGDSESVITDMWNKQYETWQVKVTLLLYSFKMEVQGKLKTNRNKTDNINSH